MRLGVLSTEKILFSKNLTGCQIYDVSDFLIWMPHLVIWRASVGSNGTNTVLFMKDTTVSECQEIGPLPQLC